MILVRVEMKERRQKEKTKSIHADANQVHENSRKRWIDMDATKAMISTILNRYQSVFSTLLYVINLHVTFWP